MGALTLCGSRDEVAGLSRRTRGLAARAAGALPPDFRLEVMPSEPGEDRWSIVINGAAELYGLDEDGLANALSRIVAETVSTGSPRRVVTGGLVRRMVGYVKQLAGDDAVKLVTVCDGTSEAPRYKILDPEGRVRSEGPAAEVYAWLVGYANGFRAGMRSG